MGHLTVNLSVKRIAYENVQIGNAGNIIVLSFYLQQTSTLGQSTEAARTQCTSIKALKKTFPKEPVYLCQNHPIGWLPHSFMIS